MLSEQATTWTPGRVQCHGKWLDRDVGDPGLNPPQTPQTLVTPGE